MNKKKIFLGIVALMLVCTLSVAGTLAYLTARSEGNGVTNTFVAETNLVSSFKLTEHKAELDTDGSYKELNKTEENLLNPGEGNTYQILPGIDLPKDPTIEISEKTEIPAYLYIEVVGELDPEVFEYSIDENWMLLEGVTGPNNGAVYSYNNEMIDDENAPTTVRIIADDTIKVKSNATETALEAIGSTGVTLKFYGYMAQASNANAQEAFERAFLATE